VNGRRGSVRYEKRIDAPADDVWELVGDPARLCEWFPGIVSSAVDGDERVVTTATGPVSYTHLIIGDDRRWGSLRISWTDGAGETEGADTMVVRSRALIDQIRNLVGEASGD